MPLETSSALTARLAPGDTRFAPLIGLVLLAGASALASLVFACATPFAAFAVIAAAMLSLRTALFVVAAPWLVNQAIGFGLLHYPVDTNTILWGFVIGGAALAATIASKAVLRMMPGSGAPVGLGVGLIGAYAAYELVLYAATPFLGGAGNFTAAIVGRLGLLNVAWLIGLVLACETIRLAQFVLRRRAATGYQTSLRR